MGFNSFEINLVTIRREDNDLLRTFDITFKFRYEICLFIAQSEGGLKFPKIKMENGVSMFVVVNVI